MHLTCFVSIHYLNDRQSEWQTPRIGLIHEVPLLLFWLCLACRPDEPAPVPVPTPEPTAETGATVVPTADTGVETGLILTADGGFTIASDLTLGDVVAQEKQDLTFTWSGLDLDARGGSTSPAQVSTLMLLEVSPSQREAVATLIDARGPTPSEVVDWWSVSTTGKSFARLSELEALGSPFVPSDYFSLALDRTWYMLLLDPDGDGENDGAEAGLDTDGDILHGATLTPAVGGGSQVVVTNSTSDWDYRVVAGDAMSASADSTPMLDWSALATDAYGQPLDLEIADELFLGRFPAGYDPAPDLVDLRSQATSWFTREVRGDSSADLSFLRTDDTSTFPGFVSGSTYVVGLRCTECLRPVPLALSIIDVP